MLVRYLEYQLATLSRPYEVAVTTYALMIANSVERNVAFNKLDQMKRKVGTYSRQTRPGITSHVCHGQSYML